MKACEATAPTPVLMCGTIAPTAKKRVATMMPMRPVGASLAMIDQVTAPPFQALDAVDNAVPASARQCVDRPRPAQRVSSRRFACLRLARGSPESTAPRPPPCSIIS
jgi:hypothetical protein